MSAPRGRRPLRIAMIGARGVPATFGGVERHVEEIGARLADRGHDVIVYARTNYVDEPRTTWRGMTIRNLTTMDSKHLDAIVHSAKGTLDAMRTGVDVVHYHAVGPGLPGALPRYLSRAKVVQTIHGRDSERAKWGRGATLVLRSAEWLSAHVPDETVVVSKHLAQHYRDAYRRRATYIPNGVDVPVLREPAAIAERWGLTTGSYLLSMGRLVPEKAPDLLLRAFRRLPGDLRLVIAGGSSYTDDFVEGLRREAAADPRVIVAGYVYGEEKDELYTNAAAFVLPSFLEGLPLTLLEAASYGSPVVASDIPPHVEVIGADGPGHRLFPSGSEEGLAEALRRSLAETRVEREGAAAFRDRVVATYRWDAVTDETEAVYRRITGR
jgi:glycosyltransferase involved in cell wall biosynthesis